MCVYMLLLCIDGLTYHTAAAPKNRDKELQLQVEEEQRKERELNRRDAALKVKLTAEARVRASYNHDELLRRDLDQTPRYPHVHTQAAERSRRREAVARELERHAKLEALRLRTEELLRVNVVDVGDRLVGARRVP